MQRAAAHMDNLVRDLLDVAAIESGRMRVERTMADLGSIVGDEVVVHQAAAEARQLQLTLHVSERPMLANFDPARISRVVMNLLTNSTKFTPNGGRIEVTVDRRGDEAHIAVQDSGRGIAADELESVFDRFAQVGTRKPGYGLGLFIARTIVDAHGGRIWADSVLGQGSTFHIVLPASAPPG